MPGGTKYTHPATLLRGTWEGPWQPPNHWEVFLKTKFWGVQMASSPLETKQLRWGGEASLDGLPGGKRPFGPQNWILKKISQWLGWLPGGPGVIGYTMPKVAGISVVPGLSLRPKRPAQVAGGPRIGLLQGHTVS